MPIVKFVKGSEEARQYMQNLRNKRKGGKKSAPAAETPAPTSAPVIEPIAIVKRGKKKVITPEC